METLAYASAYAGFTNEPAIRLAEKLVSLAYDNMAGVYFTTGGGESNESAFKFARYHWKRLGKPDKVKIISRRYGYHGVTMAAMSATSLPELPQDVRPDGAGVPAGRAALSLSLAGQRRCRHRRGGRGGGSDPGRGRRTRWPRSSPNR